MKSQWPVISIRQSAISKISLERPPKRAIDDYRRLGNSIEQSAAE